MKRSSGTPAPPAAHGRRDPHALLATLHRISGLIGALDDPAEAVRNIVAELVAFFRADAAAVALINPDTGALEIECAHGYPEEQGPIRLPPGLGLLGWAAYNNKHGLTGDAPGDPRHLPLRRETRSILVAPLEVDGQLHGAVTAESDAPEAFTEEDLGLLVRIADESARVLSRLWLIEHLRRKAGQFEVLSTIARDLGAKLQARELMETITRESHRLAGCRLATLHLFDPAKRTVRLQTAFPADIGPAALERSWSLDDSLAGSAISTRRQVEFANIRHPEYADLLDVPDLPDLAAVLSTPLMAENEVVGVLSVFTGRAHRFSNDERRLLRALANLGAVALHNSRLYQRVFESEESLRTGERLTTLGLLAAEIAHETRNPLTVIRLLFGALDLEFPETDPRHTDVAIIREKLDQLEVLVTRVLSFAKAPESMHSRWPLDDLIRETCLLIRLKLNQARIHMHYEPPARPVVVDCNKAQIQQVLLNVILNATQAMPEGGSITIGCLVQRGAGHDSVAIEIRDTGHGIPPEFQGRIFDSFLSGRPDGTGLGLAIAKRIMRSHHGDVEVAATGPDGTVMRLSLPLVR